MSEAYSDLGGQKPKLTRAEIEALIASVQPAEDEQQKAEAISFRQAMCRKGDEAFAPSFFSPTEQVRISYELARKLGHAELWEGME